MNLEAEYDRRVKEGQKKEGVTIRWELSIAKKRVAIFFFSREDNDSRVATGDELRIK